MNKIYFVIAIGIAMVSCIFKTPKQQEELRIFEENKKKFGLQFNEERIKRGVTPIKPDWQADLEPGGSFYWHNPTSPPLGKAGHSLKLTIVGEEYWGEKDRYYGFNKYILNKQDPDSTRRRESITIFYFSKDIKSGGKLYTKGFNCRLRSSDVTNKKLPDWITIEQADSILNVWGIDRLND